MEETKNPTPEDELEKEVSEEIKIIAIPQLTLQIGGDLL